MTVSNYKGIKISRKKKKKMLVSAFSFSPTVFSKALFHTVERTWGDAVCGYQSRIPTTKELTSIKCIPYTEPRN